MPALRHLTVLVALVALLATAATVAGQTDTDLSVNDFSISPEQPAPGDNVSAEVTVRKESGGDVSYTVDFKVDGQTLASRDGNDTDFVLDDTHEVTAPQFWTEVPNGSHTLEANVTADGNDTDPSNDVATVTVDIGPDLIVNSVSAEPDSPAEGDEVTLEAEVENDGPHDASSFDVSFVVNGTTVGTPTVQPLGSGSKVTVEATWTAKPGQHPVTVTADAAGTVDEVHEDNNANDDLTLDVAPTDPDLIVANIITQPIAPEPGDEVNIQATIENAGDEAADASSAKLTIDGSVITPDATVETLDPGEQAAALWTWNASAGVHELEAEADVADDVAESDEDNNVRNRTLTVGPDIAVDGVRLVPASPVAGQSVTLDANVENLGAGIDADVILVATVDGSVVAERTLDGLDAGENRQVSLGPFNATAGDHQITYTADPDDDILEAREGNNDGQISVSIPEALPDLLVAGAELTRSNVSLGETTRFNATIENAGGDGAGSFEVEFLVDGEEVGQARSLPGLGTEERSTITSGNWTAQEGAHTLHVVVDPGEGNGSVRESDEGNNRLRFSFAIGPDLTPTDLGLEPSEPRVGERVKLTATLANAGTQPAGAFDVRIEVGDEAVLEDSVAALGPLEETTLEAEWIARAGVDEARVEVDVRDAVDEVSESNNTLVSEIGVDKEVPDLVARNLSASPEHPRPGENVTFGVSIANEGPADSGPFQVRFTVNDSTLDEAQIQGLPSGEEIVVESSNWTAEAGTTNVTVHVDPADEIPEPDQGDNRVRLEVTVEESSGIPAPGALAAVAALLAAVVWRRRG